MEVPGSRFAFRRFMLVVLICLSGCLASKDAQIEHGNVAFAIARDGQRVVFSAADGNLYLLSIDARRVSQLTRTDATLSSPRFSPDGREIVYSSSVEGREGHSIVISSADGIESRRLTDNPDASDDRPSYSADGSRIAFTRAYRHRPYSMGGEVWDQVDLCVMNRDGTNLRRVTTQKYYQLGRPDFIEEDNTLLYAAMPAGEDATTELYLASLDGSQEPKRLTSPAPAGYNGGAWASEPSVSPDGKQVAFVSDRVNHFKYDIYLADIGSNEARSLGVTSVSRYNQQPIFVPDGKSLLFLAGTESNPSNRPIFSLWKVGLDGSKPVQVADSKLFSDPLHWPEIEADPEKPR